MKKLPDWLIRALKTFVQAFVATFVTILTPVVQGGIMKDLNGLKATLISALIAGLSAGISAVWNIILERVNSQGAK